MIAQERSEISLVKRRMEAAFLLFLGAILILALRLGYLQWYRARDFGRIAAQMSGRVFAIDARRGRIEDRAGNPLAIDTLAKAVLINPRIVKDPPATAHRISSLLGLPEKDEAAMAERITRGKERRSAYLKLRRGVDRKLAERLYAIATGTYGGKRGKPDAALKGIWLEDTPVRTNPSGLDGLQFLGSVNIDGEGVDGVELMFDRVLRGKNGERHARVDAAGKPVPDASDRTRPPVDGKDVRLTIDRDIQHFVEAEVRRVATEQSPDAASAIVMDVKTGEILGMANYPLPNSSKKISQAERRNRAITDLYEPGSIFKVFTAAAALESGVNTNCYCGGRRSIGKWSVGCAHGARHGAVDLRKMVEQSCNLAAGSLAERVGSKRMYEILDKFGFQSRTGIEFPGEVYARMRNPEDWKTLRTVNIGFGQGIVVTPLQMVAAYAAIANDGVYIPPTLVKSAPGWERPLKREPRAVMSPANAAALRSHMEAVVTSGTGKSAKVAGYSVAGKTGTAQLVANGRYMSGAYVASFGGFAPASKPRLAILVSVWHPRRGQYGGVVAAPVFREIARNCLDYLAIPPDTPGDLRDGRKPTQRASRGND